MKNKIKFRLCELNSEILRIMEITRLVQFLHIDKSEKESLANINK
jgi:anti-anti-sigma regulatory factor